jgi:hypothetical protein
VQLEQSRKEFAQRGFAVAAISYDPVPVLQDFSRRMKIGFPLLSDEGSRVIRAFGVLNTTVKAGALDDGVPYPGIFVVDSAAKVTGKYFEERYQERFTPATILSKQFGVTAGPPVERKTEQLKVTARLSQNTAHPGNRVSVVADIELPSKMHIYAPGVKGYRGVDLAIEKSTDVIVHQLTFPKPRILNLSAIKERVPVYERSVRLERDFTIAAATKTDTLNLKVSLEYQACDDKICYAPATLSFTFTLGVEALERQRVPANLQRKPQ